MVVAFFLCWAPFHAQRLLYVYFWDHPNFAAINEWIYHITGILYYVSSTVNPILYNVMSVKYRQAFKETLCGFVCSQKARSPDGNNRYDDYTLHSCASVRSTKSRYYTRRRDSRNGDSRTDLEVCENTNLISSGRIPSGDLALRSPNSLVMVIKPNSGKYSVLNKRSMWPKAFLWVVRSKTVSTLEVTKSGANESNGVCELNGRPKTVFRQQDRPEESAI